MSKQDMKRKDDYVHMSISFLVAPNRNRLKIRRSLFLNCIHEVRRSTDFETLKLGNIQSGVKGIEGLQTNLLIAMSF